jgi:hypothetical protein
MAAFSGGVIGYCFQLPDQGDQIWRIFVGWAIVNFGLVFKFSEIAQYFRGSYSHGKG